MKDKKETSKNKKKEDMVTVMLICDECKEQLREIHFRDDQKDKFIPSALVCFNQKCGRHGLLSVSYATKPVEEKGIKNGNNKE